MKKHLRHGLVFVITASLAASVIAGRPQGRAFEPFVWNTAAPADCPFVPSTALAGVLFKGVHSDYRCGDTFYPSWASDGNQYSPWTDGVTDGAGEEQGRDHPLTLPSMMPWM